MNRARETFLLDRINVLTERVHDNDKNLRREALHLAVDFVKIVPCDTVQKAKEFYAFLVGV